jgi:hypothetical protein
MVTSLIIDSGASAHFCPHRSKFQNLTPLSSAPIKTASGLVLNGRGSGDVKILLPNGRNRTDVILKDAIHVPEMAFTLISISRLDKADEDVRFQGGVCTITAPNGNIIGNIPHANGLYRLPGSKLEPPESLRANVATRTLSLYEAE